MKSSTKRIAACGIAAGAAVVGLFFLLRSPDPLAPLRASVEADARGFQGRRYERPVLLGNEETGVAIEQFRKSLGGIDPADLKRLPELESFVFRGSESLDEKTRVAVQEIARRNQALVEALSRAARQQIGNVSSSPVQPPSAEELRARAPKFAILLLLTDARLAAESGAFAAALDRCTAALVLSEDLGRGAPFHEALLSLQLHHSALLALAILVDLGKPNERQLQEVRRRLDVMMAHAPSTREPFESELLWWKLATLRAAGIPDYEKKDIWEQADRFLRRTRAITGTTYAQRRDAVRDLDRALRASRRFAYEADLVEQYSIGVTARQRILMVICAWEIDRLRAPSTVPDLESLPDPFDGRPLRGRYGNGSLLVYSVGPDLADDQGGAQDLRMELRR